MNPSNKDFEIRTVNIVAEQGHRRASQGIKEFISKPLPDRIFFKKDTFWPKLSIITPSYNQANFLERTILSVLNQSYPNLEYIIIDGGSNDRSIEVIKKYEKYLAYWISEPDNGQEDAINKGFKKATGDIVGWQNSDDIYLPGAFFKVCNEFKKYPDSDVVFGNMYLINEDDDILKDMRFIPFNLEHLLYYDWNLSNQTTFWKREMFYKTGYLKNCGVLFDFDWFIRLGKTTKNFRFVRRFLGGYRLHPRSKFSLVKNDIRGPLFIEIMRENGIPVDEGRKWKKQYRMKKLRAFFRKFFWYILQGDIDYVFKGALRRLKYGK